MFERALFVLVFVSLLFLSLFYYLFSFTVYLISVRHTIFNVVTAEGLKPLHSRRMRSIALWRYTILSQILSLNMTIKAIITEHILNVADVFSASDMLVQKHPCTESPLSDFRATAISRVTSVAREDDPVPKEPPKQCAAELLVDLVRKAMGELADNSEMDNSIDGQIVVRTLPAVCQDLMRNGRRGSPGRTSIPSRNTRL